MATYGDPKYLHQGSLRMFDETHKPGDPVRHSGIYRCENCGKEAACNAGDPFPPQDHSQHSPGKGAILWRLIVWAN